MRLGLQARCRAAIHVLGMCSHLAAVQGCLEKTSAGAQSNPSGAADDGELGISALYASDVRSSRVLYEDDFDEPSSVWARGGWPGGWALEEGALVHQLPCYDPYAWGAVQAVATVAAANLVARVQILLLSPFECASSGAGLMVRKEDILETVPDYHMCILGPSDSSSEDAALQLVHRIGGGFGDVLLGFVRSPMPLEEWFSLELVAEGSDLTCRVLGYPLLTVTGYDASPYAGSSGVVAEGATARFDNFSVAAIED
jgi:hypothetical protein